MQELVEGGVPCSKCGHPFVPHILVTYGENVSGGGLIFCQDPECGCAITWDVPQAGPVRNAMLPEHVVRRVPRSGQGH